MPLIQRLIGRGGKARWQAVQQPIPIDRPMPPEKKNGTPGVLRDRGLMSVIPPGSTPPVTRAGVARRDRAGRCCPWRPRSGHEISHG
jgi:hypothetical protein